jgi:fumarate hydratase, class II
MMVTALSPVIGYDKAAAISCYAIDHDLTLKEAALAKAVSEDLYVNRNKSGVRLVTSQ